MRRILDIRIVRWELKLAYVVTAIAIIFSIGALLGVWGVAQIAGLLLGTLLDFAALLIGARIFRGRGEALEPRRPWWRMTARPTLSRRLGILFMVLAVLTAVSLVLTAFGVSGVRTTVGDDASGSLAILAVLEYGGFAYLYLNSAVRLKRLGVRAPAKEPKFRPTVTLKP